MTEHEFNLLLNIKKDGLGSVRELAKRVDLSIGYVSETLRSFKDSGLIDEMSITKLGLKSLEPYKVKNAIIMAAGMSSRFVPLSLEKPKGLLVVKNEVLIERQIEQLHDAGIKDIVIVLGYKKESFFYLEEKYNVKIIINPCFNVKNNIYTLYLAQEYIGNSYICSSDNYFDKNVFEEYVYDSYYSGIRVNEKTNEYYMIPDPQGYISKVNKFGESGTVMLGHVYWNKEFAQKFIMLINEHVKIGDYNNYLWEDLFTDNVKKLPKMKIKEYPNDVIFEFDSLEELRTFDNNYIQNTHSKIVKNICKILKCNDSDIVSFKAIKEGLTNTSFVFEVKGKKYVYRHPGEGTNEIISRKHEKRALELGKKLGIDPTYIYMDEDEGWKISSFVPNIRIPNYSNINDSKRILKVLRELHNRNESVDWSFLPWEEALKIEKILRKKHSIDVADFDELKANVEKCYLATKGDGIKLRFCHCDTYAPNWMLNDSDTILIDWEYAGNADPGCDLGAYIMDAMYSIEDSEKFIKEYCGNDYNNVTRFHYLAYVAIVSYYWFVWALYREACGAVMGESLHNWYVMAKRYSAYLINK